MQKSVEGTVWIAFFVRVGMMLDMGPSPCYHARLPCHRATGKNNEADERFGLKAAMSYHPMVAHGHSQTSDDVHYPENERIDLRHPVSYIDRIKSEEKWDDNNQNHHGFTQWFTARMRLNKHAVPPSVKRMIPAARLLQESISSTYISKQPTC
jgi:hypothetical protein